MARALMPPAEESKEKQEQQRPMLKTAERANQAEAKTKLTAAALAAAAPSRQKKLLGKELHCRVLAHMTKDGTTHAQEWITGKLLETDNAMLLELLDDNKRLEDRIDNLLVWDYQSKETSCSVTPWDPSLADDTLDWGPWNRTPQKEAEKNAEEDNDKPWAWTHAEGEA